MPSTSERSFGQRYTKARGLVEHIKPIADYAPDNPDLLPAALTTFLNDVDTANNLAASTQSTLQTARDERLVLYKGPTGLIKRCSAIRDYLASKETNGKKSVEFKKLQKIVMRMRGIKLTSKLPKPPAGGTDPKKQSVSEVSYGSTLSAGKEALQVIKGLAAYAPSNTDVTVANFTTFIAQLDAKNTDIYDKQTDWENAVDDRAELYDILKTRVSKVKSALAGQYGRQSNEYKESLKY